MNRKEIEEKIGELAKKIEKLRASKPAHDVTGAYKMELLELEDELQAKKRQLQEEKA